MSKQIVLLGGLIVIVFLVIGSILSQRLTLKTYQVQSNKINHVIKVIQISDVHYHEHGENNSVLISMVEDANPDIIVITGDLFDYQGPKIAEQLIPQLVVIAPVYYAPGNHEYEVSEEAQQNNKQLLIDNGVSVIENAVETVTINEEKIQISGLYSSVSLEFEYDFYQKGIDEIVASQETQYFQLLMAHIPDYFDVYAGSNTFDLVLSGHTHGGHMRIPYTNIGLVAPGPQRVILPDYVYGMYNRDTTTMIVSSGLGGSSGLQSKIPRLGNPYEVVEITIVPE